MARRSSQAAFSLFAFQDIITSVTGIMLLITLMLALELMQRVHDAPPTQTSQQVDATQQTIIDMKQEVEALQQQLNASSEAIERLPSLDAATLAQLEDELDEDSTRLREDIDETRKDLKEKQDKLAAAQQANSSDRTQEQTELEDLEQQIATAQEQLDEIDSEDRVFFTSGVQGKTTWVVEVVATGFGVAKIGASAPPQRFSSVNAFGTWVASVDPATDALYLVVKPGGVSNFEQARQIIAAKNIQMGYQVVADSKAVLDPNNGAGKP